MKQFYTFKNINSNLFCVGLPPIALVISLLLFLYFLIVFIIKLVIQIWKAVKSKKGFFESDVNKKRLFIFLGIYLGLSSIIFLFIEKLYPISLLLLAAYLFYSFYYSTFKKIVFKWLALISLSLFFIFTILSFVPTAKEINKTIDYYRVSEIMGSINIPGEIKLDKYLKRRTSYGQRNIQPGVREVVSLYGNPDFYKQLLVGLESQGYRIVEEKIIEAQTQNSESIFFASDFPVESKGVLVEHDKYGWLSIFVVPQEDSQYKVVIRNFEIYYKEWADFRPSLMDHPMGTGSDCGLRLF